MEKYFMRYLLYYTTGWLITIILYHRVVDYNFSHYNKLELKKT